MLAAALTISRSPNCRHHGRADCGHEPNLLDSLWRRALQNTRTALTWTCHPFDVELSVVVLAGLLRWFSVFAMRSRERRPSTSRLAPRRRRAYVSARKAAIASACERAVGSNGAEGPSGGRRRRQGWRPGPPAQMARTDKRDERTKSTSPARVLPPLGLVPPSGRRCARHPLRPSLMSTSPAAYAQVMASVTVNGRRCLQHRVRAAPHRRAILLSASLAAETLYLHGEPGGTTDPLTPAAYVPLSQGSHPSACATVRRVAPPFLESKKPCDVTYSTEP